jgi:DNA repair photolyase
MSKITATIGGKAKGKADQVSIDPALGCKYLCVGCYAKKSCQRGKNYDHVVSRDLDKKVLQKSIRAAKRSGFQLARIGKHCDPGDHIDSLNGILECCNDEGFRGVVVSKGLEFNRCTASLMAAGNHILHMSLGPYSPVCPPEKVRLHTAMDYYDRGVRAYIRLTRDVTQEISEWDRFVSSMFDCIVTPMRYASKTILDFYKSDPQSFEFVSGYYRPKRIHSSWLPYINFMCGEINGEARCCDCLTGD